MTPPSVAGTDPSHGLVDLAVVQPEHLFHVIFEQVAVGMALIETATGRFLRINQRYCDIVGLSRDDMTVTTFKAITHPDDLQADLSNMEELKAGRIRNFSMEKRYFRSDGSIVWVDLTVSPIWKVGEQPTFHIAVVQDITERKRAQEALRMTEGQLTEVLKNSTAMVFMKDREGRYLLVNHAFERRVGLTAAQIIGKTDVGIFPASQAAFFQVNDREVIQSGRLMEFEEVARYADGDHVSIVIKFPLRNAERSIYAVCGIVTDITDRKQAEQCLADLNATLEQQVVQRTRELVESRQQLQAILDGTSDAVFVKDPEGRYLLANSATGRFVGKRQDEVIGRDDRSIFLPADAQAVMEGDRKVMTGGGTMTYEDVVTTADGVRRTFLSTKGPLFDGQGRVTGLFGICRDITERKQAEEQLRESEERLNQAIHLAKIGIFDHDHRTETLYWSPTIREIYGVPTDEPASLDGYIQLVHPDDRDAIVAAVRRAHDPAGEGLYRVEHRLARRDGTVRWVSLQSRTNFDGEGPTRKPVRTMGAMIDMTERKQAEEALLQLNETLEQRVAERTDALLASEVFNREVLDSLSAHVAVLDASGVIIAVNRVWEQAALRNDPSGLAQVSLGANYLEVCERAADTSSEARRILDGISDVLVGRIPVFESEYLCAWSGHQQWFSMRVTPLSDRGGCVITHEDVTDRKRADAALLDSYHRLQVLSREVQVAKEQERSRLSRELHDEFGQVLSGLKLELTTVATSLSTGHAATATCMKVKKAIGMVDRLFVSLREMVSALRSSILDELGLVPALETFVAEVQEQSSLQLDFVTGSIDSHPRWGVEVEGALFRITQELLTNVLRHAQATTATVTLGSEGGQIVLTVRDNGRGFNMHQARTKSRFGLRGVQERAELLGGTMTIDSMRKVGTTVTVRIPIELPLSNVPQVDLDRPLKSGSPRTRPRHGH